DALDALAPGCAEGLPLRGVPGLVVAQQGGVAFAEPPERGAMKIGQLGPAALVVVLGLLQITAAALLEGDPLRTVFVLDRLLPVVVALAQFVGVTPHRR